MGLTKYNRILDIYVRIMEGKAVNKDEEAARFGVNKRTIQRDIDSIRDFFAEKTASGKGGYSIKYDGAKKGFVLSGGDGSMLDNDEIFAVCKILIASRAFTKKTMDSMLDKIISGCVPQKDMKLVVDSVKNERFHYMPLKNPSDPKISMWKLGEHIKDFDVLQISYRKQGASVKDTVKRLVEPCAIVFSEYYFYLIAHIVKKNEAGTLCHKHDYPAIFRVDRIVSFKPVGIKFKVDYSNRFEEGEFRNRVQFMYPGELLKLKFRYTGKSVDAILDRLPTAAIVSNDENGVVISAEVFGNGIIMWLLSQGENVEVLSPEALREKVGMTIERMKAMYGEESKISGF